jgi:hypothetical protein
MSTQQKQDIAMVVNWVLKITLAVSAYFIAAFIGETRADVKAVLQQQAKTAEILRAMEKTVDKLERYHDLAN